MAKKPIFLMILAFLTILSGTTFGQIPFDFSDEFYRKNGIDPDKLLSRITADGGKAVIDDSNPREDFTNVRNIEITGGFDAGGTLIYYSVFGMVMPDTFTPDQAGLKAMTTANQFRAFIFPKKDGEPLSPEPDNRRQDNLFDTGGGYFDNDPLGNWRLVFVNFTEAATKTLFGRRELRELEKRNGTDFDGTPIIRRVIEIDDLAAKGLVRLQMRAPDGSQGFPWVI